MDTRWQTTRMDCDACGYEWAAVHPAICEYLQCPVCGHLTPAPATPEPMKLLNLGCGGHRPQDLEWWNLDELRKHLKPGTPERTNLDAEPRYIDWNLVEAPVPPFAGQDLERWDGILCQHVVEHLTCHEAVLMLAGCRTVLADGGWMAVSVPDASYFLTNLYRDTRENAEDVFGEPISEPQYERFFDYALFHREHKQVLTRDSLRCLLTAAGFRQIDVFPIEAVDEMTCDGRSGNQVVRKMREQLNRRMFSVIYFVRKVVVNG